jgi:hypothetical protein
MLWLRFLDDIFLIWTHGQTDLEVFIERINSFHPNIKFTHQYSPTKATFLDVSIVKNSDNKLETNVFEKSTNCHQYIEFSSCHPTSCKAGIPYSQAKRYRRITSDNEMFIADCDRIRQHFKDRNYPDDIVNHAISKASSLTQQEALRSTMKDKQDIIPFVCTYNPSLPNIGKVINQYWGLLKYSSNKSVRDIFNSKPVVAFKRPTNLQDILVHSKMQTRNISTGQVLKCDRPRCSHCNHITESNKFVSTIFSTQHQIKQDLTCSSTDVIYLITCKKCKKQYVGQTHQKCSMRMNSHKYDIKHYPDTLTTVAEHFNSENHSLNDFSFMPIEKVTDNWKRLLKETKWIYKLGTLSPNGMNSKILY